MGRVMFALKPSLLRAQCSILREQAHWFYRESSPLCPGCAFLWELAWNMMCLSCSRHKAGNTHTPLYVLTMQELVLQGFNAAMQHLPALHYRACTAISYCIFWKNCFLLPPSSHPNGTSLKSADLLWLTKLCGWAWQCMCCTEEGNQTLNQWTQ